MAHYESTLCFRRFRKKHTELSKVYWTHVVGADLIERSLPSVKTPLVLDTIKGAVPPAQLPLSVGEMSQWLPEYLDRVRLHLLLVCASNVEAYLKEITIVFLISTGHAKDFTSLTSVGEAMGRPILNVNSLPSPLGYASELFSVDLGEHAKKWDRFYKLRCALAHNGGVVTARTLKEVPDIGIPVGEFIGLTWKQLFSALQAADEIVMAIDLKLAGAKIKRAEIFRELQLLKEAGALPPKGKVLTFLHDTYGFSPKLKPMFEAIRRDIYLS